MGTIAIRQQVFQLRCVADALRDQLVDCGIEQAQRIAVTVQIGAGIGSPSVESAGSSPACSTRVIVVAVVPVLLVSARFTLPPLAPIR